MKNLDQVQQHIEESLWFTHATRLWTCDINIKKPALRGLKKIVDDM